MTDEFMEKIEKVYDAMFKHTRVLSCHIIFTNYVSLKSSSSAHEDFEA